MDTPGAEKGKADEVAAKVPAKERVPPSLAENVYMSILVVACLAGAVLLALPLDGPPSLIAMLVAIAAATIVHRWLGGIDLKSQLNWKWFRFGGALAALVGLYILLNGHLEKQIASAGHRPDDLEGIWVHSYPEENWRAQYTFSLAPRDAITEALLQVLDPGPVRYRVDGAVWYVSDGLRQLRYQVIKGEALATHKSLTLKLRMREVETEAKLDWVTTIPLSYAPAVVGGVQVTQAGITRPKHWGIVLVREKVVP